MAFPRIFKRDKEKGKTAEKAKVLGEKKSGPSDEAISLKRDMEKGGKALKEPQPQSVSSYQNILRPHITEKATRLAQMNQYVFVVSPRATKNELKMAIKQLYQVDVEKVRILYAPSKKVRLGRVEGVRSGYKKAIATVRKGQKIELLPR